MEISKQIFIIGSGRCGTTWIGQWLRQHPEAFGGPETHLFAILDLLINPSWEQGVKRWLSYDLLMDKIKLFAIDLLGSCKFRQNNEPYLIEHSSIHYFHKTIIKKIFPDALFVHIYRDGRNVVESWLRTNPSKTHSEHIGLWKQIITDMQANKDDNTLNIQYEDIMENPQKSRIITEFLGLKHHKDIDSWEFPVNTSNFSYDYNRWKTLPKHIQEEFKQTEIQNLLKSLSYL